MCRVGRFTQTTSNGISLRGIRGNVAILFTAVSCTLSFRSLKTFGEDAAEGYFLGVLTTSAKVWNMGGFSGAVGVSNLPLTSRDPPGFPSGGA